MVITRAFRTANHPTHSLFRLIFARLRGAAEIIMWPIPNSRINSGIPRRMIAAKYGIRNAPPPNLAQTYGNRHTFPSPTAEPMAAITNPTRLFHC